MNIHHFSLKKIPVGFSYLILCLMLAILFAVYQPHVKNMVFAQSRTNLWDSFSQQVDQREQIDPEEYWKLREFYYPGHFIFNKEGLSTAQSKLAFDLASAPIYLDQVNSIFLFKDTPVLKSFDAYTTSNKIDNLLNSDLKDKKILFKDEASVIFEDTNMISIIFIKSIDEMKKVNGMFNYNEDAYLMKDKFWLSVMRLKI